MSIGVGGWARKADGESTLEAKMRFFKRKPEADRPPRRCSVCRELLPDAAQTCRMCGHPASPSEAGGAETPRP